MRVDVATARRAAIAAPSAGTAHLAGPGLAADLRTLLKPGITLFVMSTAVAGYLFGARAGIELVVLLGLILGTTLTAGGSGALNHLIERKQDARMQRTAERPLPAGRVSHTFVLAYGLGMLAAGLLLLLSLTNALTAGLAAVTSLGYLGVYTPLKRRTSLNTFVGAVPGALPALGGYAAATGTLGAGGWIAFAILFLWQLPHFFSLAWMYRDDYARGGFVMLPNRYPDGRVTAGVALAATLALVVVGVLPSALGFAGWLYLGGMLVLGTGFTLPAFAFAGEPSDLRARRLLVASIAYVPIFVLLVVLDYILCR